MAQYIYPAIFTPEDGGGYSIRFPDIVNCFTDGEDLSSAIENAEDVLCLMIYEMEQAENNIPLASDVLTVQKQLQEGEFVSLITCDTIEYRKFYDNKAVKKTLTIPSWLNDLSERANLNFSAILQEALKKELDIKDR